MEIVSIPPPKHPGIVAKVHRLIEQRRYAVTGHARKRMDQREVSILEVRDVLVRGKRDPKKDQFHLNDASGGKLGRWSYAFVRQGLDRKLRVCVSFLKDEAEKPPLIVTVIDET